MSPLTHLQRMQLEAHDGIVLLRGTIPTGDMIYAYVRASREDIEEMQRAYERGEMIDYSNYQGIIKHDWGEPSDNVKRWMEQQYHFTHA